MPRPKQHDSFSDGKDIQNIPSPTPPAREDAKHKLRLLFSAVPHEIWWACKPPVSQMETTGSQTSRPKPNKGNGVGFWLGPVPHKPFLAKRFNWNGVELTLTYSIYPSLKKDPGKDCRNISRKRSCCPTPKLKKTKKRGGGALCYPHFVRMSGLGTALYWEVPAQGYVLGEPKGGFTCGLSWRLVHQGPQTHFHPKVLTVSCITWSKPFGNRPHTFGLSSFIDSDPCDQ